MVIPAKFSGSDILARDEAPVQLQDLRSGDQAKPPQGRPTAKESFLNMLKGDEPSDSEVRV